MMNDGSKQMLIAVDLDTPLQQSSSGVYIFVELLVYGDITVE